MRGGNAYVGVGWDFASKHKHMALTDFKFYAHKTVVLEKLLY